MPRYHVSTSYTVDCPTREDAMSYAPWPHPYVKSVIVGTADRMVIAIEDENDQHNVEPVNEVK